MKLLFYMGKGLISGWDSSTSQINCVKISSFLAKIFKDL